MRRLMDGRACLAAALAAAVLAAPGHADQVLAPSEIAAAAPRGDWATIPRADLLVMDLAADRAGRPRRVVIQLGSASFGQGWIANIRTLAAAHWWNGLSINRVQDNYVVQWGDPDGDDKAKARPLPPDLAKVAEREYVLRARPPLKVLPVRDAYAAQVGVWRGWPFASDGRAAWPIHCYGTVGVGRDLSPDTGSGAELYVVIGHAPRHLDRNIAVVGRVIEGIEHLSSLPRGTGALGFYQTAAERVPIASIRLGSDVPDLPTYEYLSTETASFARYAEARVNRKDAFFNLPAGGADICNVPVPVRRVGGAALPVRP